jgi:hypothetical protein
VRHINDIINGETRNYVTEREDLKVLIKRRKLTSVKVEEIIVKHYTGNYDTISNLVKEYDTTESAVRNILKGNTWKSVTSRPDMQQHIKKWNAKKRARTNSSSET